MTHRIPHQSWLAAAALVAVAGAISIASCSTPAAPSAAILPAPPPSQAGTAPAGDIQAQADALRIDEALRQRFEYYLAGMEERTMAQILHDADLDLAAHLPSTAAADAQHLLRQYIAYRQAAAKLAFTPNPTDSEATQAQHRLAAIRALRPQFFTEREYRGLFAWQDAYDDDALARLAIAQDPKLDAASKQRRLAALDARTAPSLVQSRQATVAHLTLDQAVKAARASGANDADIYRLRAASVGPDAATRLAALDRDDADWQQRIASYKTDRAAIQADPTLTDTARQTALQALKDSRFNALEQKRLGAYE